MKIDDGTWDIMEDLELKIECLFYVSLQREYWMVGYDGMSSSRSVSLFEWSEDNNVPFLL